jgi:Ser/Thr protein kinase RdoA (MazF antagonist)
LDQTALSSAAQLLAKFHKAASPYTSQLSTRHKFLRSVSDIKDEAATIITSINEKLYLDETDAQLMKNIRLNLQVLETLPAVENFLLEASKDSLVHGDFHNENIVFKHNNAVSFCGKRSLPKLTIRII